MIRARQGSPINMVISTAYSVLAIVFLSAVAAPPSICAETLPSPTPTYPAKPPSAPSITSGGAQCRTDEIIVKFKQPSVAGFSTSELERFTSFVARWQLDNRSFSQLAKLGSEISVNDLYSSLTQAREKAIALKRSIMARFPERAPRAMSGTAFEDFASVYSLKFTQSPDLGAAMLELAATDIVEYAVPDCLVQPSQTAPDDPLADQLWGMQRISASQAWRLSMGEGIVVAVLDTGIDLTHPDLAANIWSNSLEVPDNCIDDDLNGYIDDFRGYNFVQVPEELVDCGANGMVGSKIIDANGHGTHVAGTIGARATNGVGVYGVAPKGLLMPLKGLGYGDQRDQGYLSELIEGLLYAAKNGAHIINNSWGGDGIALPQLEDALAAVNSLGVLAVFAAGNSGIQIGSESFLSKNLSINVAAIGDDNSLASFSNYGSAITVVAPGVNILSTWSSNARKEPSAMYRSLRGTSMAAPHVSGAIALMLSLNQGLSRVGLQTLLATSSSDLGISGYDPVFGNGLIDALAASEAAIKSIGQEATLNASVTIVSPVSGSVFSPLNDLERFNVIGDFSGQGIKDVKLFIGRAENTWLDSATLTWRELPVLDSWRTSGRIAQLQAASLRAGSYALRLEALNAFAQKLTSTVAFKVDAPGIATIDVVPYELDGFAGTLQYRRPSTVGFQQLALNADGSSKREFWVHEVNSGKKLPLPLPADINRRQIRAFDSTSVLYYQDSYYDWDANSWVPQLPGFYSYDFTRQATRLVKSCFNASGPFAGKTGNCLQAPMISEGNVTVGLRLDVNPSELIAIDSSGNTRILARESKEVSITNIRLMRGRFLYVLTTDRTSSTLTTYRVNEYDLALKTPGRNVFSTSISPSIQAPFLERNNQDRLLIKVLSADQTGATHYRYDILQILPGGSGPRKIFTGEVLNVHISGDILTYWDLVTRTLRARNVATGKDLLVTLRSPSRGSLSGFSTGSKILWAEPNDRLEAWELKTSTAPLRLMLTPTPQPTPYAYR